MSAILRNVVFLGLFSCTQFLMFVLATLGANPANASSHPKHVRVLLSPIIACLQKVGGENRFNI